MTVNNWLCEQCGELFYCPPCRADTAKFCSVACRGKAQKAANKRIAFTCEICGDVFLATKDHGALRRFCSRNCFKSQKNHRIDATCPQCGDSFKATFRPNKGIYRKYCSIACRRKGTPSSRVTVNCFSCDKSFDIPKCKAAEDRNEYFCSRKCVTKARNGPNHHNYKGGSYICETSGHRMMSIPNPDGRIGIWAWKAEHRLVAEKVIGRTLQYCGEPMLHLNGIRDDNRPENLFVCDSMSTLKGIMDNLLPFPRSSNLQELRALNRKGK